jgi:hypothetical protein
MYAAGIADLLLAPEVRWPGPVVLASSSDYIVQALLVVGLAGTLVAVAGLLGASLRSPRRRDRGWGLAVGSSAALLGHALLLLGALATAARGAATGPDPLAWGYPAALVGAVVLGTAALDARILPRWCGLLLVFGYPLAALPWGSWAGEWMMLGPRGPRWGTRSYRVGTPRPMVRPRGTFGFRADGTAACGAGGPPLAPARCVLREGSAATQGGEPDGREKAGPSRGSYRRGPEEGSGRSW